MIILLGKSVTQKYKSRLRCHCGTEFETYAKDVRSKHTQSCGCRIRNRQDTKHPAYKTWQAMKVRCKNVANKNYGGRGISVCSRWRRSFGSFVSDMGPRQKGQSLDRVNPNGNYSPGNCRWATALEQANNKRNNVKTYEGLTIAQLARKVGIGETTLRWRIVSGWSHGAVANTPVKSGKNRFKKWRKT